MQLSPMRRIAATASVLVIATAVAATLALPSTAGAARPQKPTDYRLTIDGDRAPSSVAAGAKVTISMRVRNSGAPSNATPQTRLWISKDAKRGPGDRVVGSFPMKPSGVYQSVTRNHTFTWPAAETGERYLVACADHNAKVAEGSEKNNCDYHRVTVIAPTPTINIVAARPGAEGSASAPGSVQFDVALSAASSKPVTFSFYLAGSGEANSANYTDFSANQVPWVIPAGQTQVTVSMPLIGDAVPEPDESVYGLLISVVGADFGTGRLGSAIVNDD